MTTPAPRPTAGRSLALTAALILAIAGCGGASGSGSASGGSPTNDAKSATAEPATTKKATSARGKAVQFAECMRAQGIADFPDPDASGGLTIENVANDSTIDTDGPAWIQALEACRDLQPAGFTGSRRSPEQQKAAVAFAQCVREHGVADFPDPGPDDALIDTTRIPSAAGRGALEIPGLQEALDACGERWAAKAGVTAP
ncbi:MAG: hypothetical protein J7513_13860 [Solirubrobacteraceae bacterium]|nr:hypothetical protein [Solirubrobacteraceae bacterium]